MSKSLHLSDKIFKAPVKIASSSSFYIGLMAKTTQLSPKKVPSTAIKTTMFRNITTWTTHTKE